MCLLTDGGHRSLKHVVLLKCTSKSLNAGSHPVYLDLKAAKIQALWRGVLARGGTTLGLTKKFLELDLSGGNIMQLR